MSGVLRFFRSSIGAKIVMAITGVAMLGWIVAHLTGNLLIFLGPDAMNEYARFLHEDIAKVVWATRIGLLGIIVLHIASAVRLVSMNAAARPVRYQNPHYSASTYASRTMKWSGLIVLFFIVYHLLHFTLGIVQHDHTVFTAVSKFGKEIPDVYKMVVLGFKTPVVAIFYLIAQALLMMHLSHGVSSVFQTLGLTNEKYKAFTSKVGPAVAVTLFLGFASIPVSVLLGFITIK